MAVSYRIAAAVALVAVAASPALAFRAGSSGGDREPAGGAFNSSYTYPGSTGVQQGGPPRSVDIPRGGYSQPYGYDPYSPYQPRYYYRR